MQKETIVSQLEVLSPHFPGGTEESQVTSWPKKLVIGPGSNSGHSRIRYTNADLSTTSVARNEVAVLFSIEFGVDSVFESVTGVVARTEHQVQQCVLTPMVGITLTF